VHDGLSDPPPITCTDRWGREWNVEHGTRTAYNKYGCRCEHCRLAQTVYMRELRGNQPRRVAQHGTRSKYTGGCRCSPCKKANNEYQKAWAYLHRRGLSFRAEWED